MKRSLYLFLLVVPTLALPAQAGIFSKRAPINPDTRVPELLYIVKSDANESKRTAAAVELREYDARKYPEVYAVLIDALQNDTKPSVRREAALSLGRLRPIHPAAGQALQRAAAKDPSLRVRIQAWSALKMYQVSGYSSRSPAEPPTKATAQPSAPAQVTISSPLQTPPLTPPQNPTLRRPTTTQEPPLADAPADGTNGSATTPRQNSLVSRRLPQGAPAVQANQVRPAPLPRVVDEGPALVPQQQ